MIGANWAKIRIVILTLELEISKKVLLLECMDPKMDISNKIMVIDFMYDHYIFSIFNLWLD